MKTKLIASFLLLTLLVSIYFFWQHTETGCDLQEGRWASNGSYCITRSCYKNNACGELVAPIKRCPILKAGDPISEVYFQLGNPQSINGSIYTWPVGKAESGIIEAVIFNKQLNAINCNET